MPSPSVVDLGGGRFLLDLQFRDHEGLVASYLLPQEEGWTLVETGPSTCRAALLRGVRDAGVGPDEIRRVFVTHIHLDHAGALGALAVDLPNAALYAHERGVPHLLDPTRLAASARRAWGAAADRLWGPILPVPPHRLHPLVGGETFPLRGGDLRVLPTPGHASHHLSFIDSERRALLSGDSAGVRVPGGWRARPAIPPPDLDLDLLFQSLDTMAQAAPETILYSHFGSSPGALEELSRYRRTVDEWRAVALAVARDTPNVERVAASLRDFEERAAAAGGASTAREDLGSMISGYDLAAQGLLRYFATRGLIPG